MEHLIDTVRRYPCLWNTAALEYRDQELKDAAWAEVMKETDLSSVKEVKLKWKKLRDSYRDALKRQSELLAKEPGAGKKAYPWKYMGQMQFLQPYMSNRKKAAEGAPEPAPAPAADSSSGAESASSAPAPRRKRRAPGPDPLDIFFNGMCQTTKRLPLQAQIEIKKTLFGAVIAAEQALLAHHQTLAGLWPRARSSSSSSERPC